MKAQVMALGGSVIEVHFFVGGGSTLVQCTDECGRRRTFRYVKLCLGGAIGASFGGGAVKGMDGPRCRADRYKGWFFELGAAAGPFSGGADVGYNSNGPFGPGTLSGVVEAGGGIGLPRGAKVKATWCYYWHIQ